ncbi:patched domain-containing protein 3 [Takifugu rubripes]|uniref:patched domain-containing protein 3 n=1 Tax=Takifugu rubripes TaxID=31033 RepID=UPI00114580CF|nr:patched domain-containing protein 3 [Takifugu rubripes]
MVRLGSDCLEKRLRLCFEVMGHLVGSHPWWFLVAPLLLSTGLGSGFYFLEDRLANDIEEQFTPVDGQAKEERRYIRETFPGNESLFSRLRLSTSGTYGTLIATSEGGVLTAEALQNIAELDSEVRSMVVHHGNQSFAYEDLCAGALGSCAPNDILDVTVGNRVNLTFPWFHSENGSFPLHGSLGGVELCRNRSAVLSSRAIQLFYYLRQDEGAKTDLWLQGFLHLVSNASTASLQVSYSTSRSMQWEFQKTPGSVIRLFSAAYAIAITFSIISCWRLDNVRTKVWVALCGVLSTALAVLSGFGTLLLLDQPFVMTAASCPFMILGVGLDDMFILIACWRRTRVLDSVPDRLAGTYGDAGVSISITTLTNALALFVGYSSPFGSVRSFCLYAGVSVCFCYLYSVTFLGACMALNGRREAKDQHWFTCGKVPEDLPPKTSKISSICCLAGQPNGIMEEEEPEAMSHVFEKFYGPFLTHKWVKVCVLLVYAGYLAVSIYGCLILKEGLDTKHLALDDSYIIDYFEDQRQHFSDYGLNVMVAVKQPLRYWDQPERERLRSCMSEFESLTFVSGTLAWFLSFQRYAKTNDLNLTSRAAFHTHLSRFLEVDSIFKLDLNLSAGGQIQASRFFIQTLQKIPKEEVMVKLRQTAAECPVPLLVFHPAFIYFDQYTVVRAKTVQTVLVAAVAMLVVSLALMPSPLCPVWVAFSVCSVIVGVTGFMALWGVNLDSISMINLVMCTGFSVDFSAHVSYAFVSSSKTDVNKKATDALARLGYPILQGALSTILGVVLLSLSGSYIFRTFFKVIFLVITSGLIHGLVFIPVILTLLAACSAKASSDDG